MKRMIFGSIAWLAGIWIVGQGQVISVTARQEVNRMSVLLLFIVGLLTMVLAAAIIWDGSKAYRV